MGKETTNNGWICLHRTFRDWQHYGEPTIMLVFLDLLLSVNISDGWWQGHRCERGATFKSIRSIADDTRLNPMTVQRALRVLEQTGEIKQRKIDQKHTKKIICKFSQYQDINGSCVSLNNTQNNTQDNTQDNTKQQYNNNNNNINNNIYITRTHEKNILDDFFQSESLLQQFCYNERITVEQCKTLAEEVVTEWSITGEQHPNETQARKHLIYSIQNKIRQKREQGVSFEPLQERRAKFIAECRELVAQGYDKNEVNNFANYYLQPSNDGSGRMLFETFRGWHTETRFKLNINRK